MDAELFKWGGKQKGEVSYDIDIIPLLLSVYYELEENL